MKKTYNKLVRDKIPDIISSNGEKPITRVLDDKEYKIELEKKLNEECQEVLSSTTSSERIEELADMLEIISSLAELEGKNIDDVFAVSVEKKNKRGGFSKKIFLELVDD